MVSGRNGENHSQHPDAGGLEAGYLGTWENHGPPPPAPQGEAGRGTFLPVPSDPYLGV